MGNNISFQDDRGHSGYSSCPADPSISMIASSRNIKASQEAREFSLKPVQKIACLGSGFVGGPTSAVIALKTGLEVTVVDIDKERIDAWKSDSLPIFEPHLMDIVKTVRDEQITSQDGVENLDVAQGTAAYLTPNVTPKKPFETLLKRKHKPNLFFSTDVEGAIQEADLIFVCVNTPTKSGGIRKVAPVDLKYVEEATRTIARAATSSKIIVEKSTVPCKTAETIRQILDENSKPGVSFEVLSNPEFLSEGTAIKDLLYPDRVIIGSAKTLMGQKVASALVDIYAHWVPRHRIVTMNIWSSELAKLAANAMLAQRVSSVNALSAICEATGADVEEVAHAVGLDSRIGAGMLKAGPGFGGSCFQKDIFNLLYLAESLKLYEVADYWRSIIKLNEYQKQRFTRRIVSCLSNNVMNKKVAILGFAFKKDTSDTRESPAIDLVKNLVAEGASIAVYDPCVKEDQIWKELLADGIDVQDIEEKVEIFKNVYDACDLADAVVVVTEWEEFSNKDLRPQMAQLSMPEIPTNSLIGFSSTQGPQATLPAPHLLSNNVSNQASSRVSDSLTTYLTLTHPPSTPGTVQITNHTTSNTFSPIASGTLTPATDPFLSPASVPVRSKDTFPQRVDWSWVARRMKKPRLVFDARNILDVDKLTKMSFVVESIGKPSQDVHLRAGF